MEILIGFIAMTIIGLLKKYVKETLFINVVLIIICFVGAWVYAYYTGKPISFWNVFAWAGSIYGILKGLDNEIKKYDE